MPVIVSETDTGLKRYEPGSGLSWRPHRKDRRSVIQIDYGKIPVECENCRHKIPREYIARHYLKCTHISVTIGKRPLEEDTQNFRAFWNAIEGDSQNTRACPECGEKFHKLGSHIPRKHHKPNISSGTRAKR